jgi:O-antigen/teichoic acid export membrane protein
MVTSVFGLGLRIGLNLLLIPIYGYLGPCLAFFLSETALLIIWVSKLTRLGYPIALLKIVWRPLLACGGIGVALYFLKGASLLWLLPATAGGLVIYLLILFLLGAFSGSDLQLAREGLAFARPFLAKWSRQPATPK